MKVCLTCRSTYPSNEIACTTCGCEPDKKFGFTSYAPNLAETQEGFKSDFYRDYAHLEASHFWFRARARLITWALKKYHNQLGSFFEVGCGTGYILSKITKAFPSSRLLGSEIFSEGLKFSNTRLPSAELIQMDARNIPFTDEFDVIGAFDVLEHIKEDRIVLRQMHQALKEDGIILLTVPQHPWLWSKVDEHSCHVRRYTAADVHQKIKDAGFSILRSTSFVTTLLPLMIISRMLKRKHSEDGDTTAELAIPKPLNRLLYFCMLLEHFFIKIGGNIPIGGSRLIIAKKVK